MRKRRVKLLTGDEGEGQSLRILVPAAMAGTERTVDLPAPDLSPESLERLKADFLASLRWEA